MHRPLYALVVLLETLACSLLLVKSAHSQPKPLWTSRFTTAAVVHAWPLNRLYQDSAQSDESVQEPSSSNDHNSTDRVTVGTSPLRGQGEPNAAKEILPWNSGDREAVSKESTSSLRWVTEAGEAKGIQVFEFSGPGTSVRMDGTIRYGSGYGLSDETLLREGALSDISNRVVEDAGLPKGEAGDLVEAPASSVDRPADSTEAREVRQALDSAAARAAELTRQIWFGTWVPYLAPRSPVEVSRPSSDQELSSRDAREILESLSGTVNQVQVVAQDAWQAALLPLQISVSSQLATSGYEMVETLRSSYTEISYRAEKYRQEEPLIQTANALDQLGVRLQQAAGYLRFLAMERIAEAGAPRHVARRTPK